MDFDQDEDAPVGRGDVAGAAPRNGLAEQLGDMGIVNEEANDQEQAAGEGRRGNFMMDEELQQRLIEFAQINGLRWERPLDPAEVIPNEIARNQRRRHFQEGEPRGFQIEDFSDSEDESGDEEGDEGGDGDDDDEEDGEEEEDQEQDGQEVHQVDQDDGEPPRQRMRMEDFQPMPQPARPPRVGHAAPQVPPPQIVRPPRVGHAARPIPMPNPDSDDDDNQPDDGEAPRGRMRMEDFLPRAVGHADPQIVRPPRVGHAARPNPVPPPVDVEPQAVWNVIAAGRVALQRALRPNQQRRELDNLQREWQEEQRKSFDLRRALEQEQARHRGPLFGFQPILWDEMVFLHQQERQRVFAAVQLLEMNHGMDELRRMEAEETQRQLQLQVERDNLDRLIIERTRLSQEALARIQPLGLRINEDLERLQRENAGNRGQPENQEGADQQLHNIIAEHRPGQNGERDLEEGRQFLIERSRERIQEIQARNNHLREAREALESNRQAREDEQRVREQLNQTTAKLTIIRNRMLQVEQNLRPQVVRPQGPQELRIPVVRPPHLRPRYAARPVNLGILPPAAPQDPEIIRAQLEHLLEHQRQMVQHFRNEQEIQANVIREAQAAVDQAQARLGPRPPINPLDILNALPPAVREANQVNWNRGNGQGYQDIEHFRRRQQLQQIQQQQLLQAAHERLGIAVNPVRPRAELIPVEPPMDGLEQATIELRMLKTHMTLIQERGGPIITEENLREFDQLLETVRAIPEDRREEKVDQILLQLRRYREQLLRDFPMVVQQDLEEAQPRQPLAPNQMPHHPILVRNHMAPPEPRPVERDNPLRNVMERQERMRALVQRPFLDNIEPPIPRNNRDGAQDIIDLGLGQRGKEKRMPESHELYLPRLGVNNVRRWTKADVMTWVKFFITNEAHIHLISTKEFDGYKLYNELKSDRLWRYEHFPFGLYISLKSHMNRVVNDYNGYVYEGE